jgi:CheY-like chemotaxis protein
VEKPVARECLVEAFATIQHSVGSRRKKLLLVTPNHARRENLESLLSGPDIEIVNVGTGGAALDVTRHVCVETIVIDLRVSDMAATDLVEQIQQEIGRRTPPVVLYGKRGATEHESSKLARLSHFRVVKQARSPERLFYETALLLHRAEVDLTDEQRKLLAEIVRKEETLAGRAVLIVDDDVRAIFALTSVLEQHRLTVFYAENGRAGIDLLRKIGGVDVVLMDVMMPEMDGYQTIRGIRDLPEFKELPIIAVTAKAMKGDREKCIAAGASEYIPKPVDVNQLFSMMRVCLARGSETAIAALEARA